MMMMTILGRSPLLVRSEVQQWVAWPGHRGILRSADSVRELCLASDSTDFMGGVHLRHEENDDMSKIRASILRVMWLVVGP